MSHQEPSHRSLHPPDAASVANWLLAADSLSKAYTCILGPFPHAYTPFSRTAHIYHWRMQGVWRYSKLSQILDNSESHRAPFRISWDLCIVIQLLLPSTASFPSSESLILRVFPRIQIFIYESASWGTWPMNHRNVLLLLTFRPWILATIVQVVQAYVGAYS